MVACQKGRFCVVAISVSVLVILGWNCTLATCCPLVSHIDYAPCALLRLEKYGTDRRTDARCITFIARCGQQNRMLLKLVTFMCNKSFSVQSYRNLVDSTQHYRMVKILCH